VAPLLWGRWCHECLLLGVGVDLSGVSRLKACSWGSCRCFRPATYYGEYPK
jgi:hypothetical protein